MVATMNTTCWQGTIVSCHIVYFIRSSERNSALYCLLDISSEVEALHELGIILNDIRWDNIMEHKGRCLLIDFDDAYPKRDWNDVCPAQPRLGKEEYWVPTEIQFRAV